MLYCLTLDTQFGRTPLLKEVVQWHCGEPTNIINDVAPITVEIQADGDELLAITKQSH